MKQKILVVVSGMTPQIITETVFALAQNTKWIPEKILVLTTHEGRKKIIGQLLGENGYFQRLCKEYALPEIEFDEHSIQVISEHGQELDDIRTPQQNSAAADMIVRTIYDLCADKQTELHVSIAGGRKSMGFYIGYALSLFGRKQDKMSHVLVEEAFEMHPEFFYPPKESQILNTRDFGMQDAAKAQVMLAEIPFVRMGEGKPDLALHENWTFSQAVERTQELLDDITIKIDVKNLRIHFGSVSIDSLTPREFAVYMTLAELRANHHQGESNADSISPEVSLIDEEAFTERVWKNYAPIRTKKSDDITLETWKEEELDKGYSFFWARFAEDRSNISKKFKKALGDYGKKFAITAKGKYGNKKYTLDISPESILIVK